jgi:hypothetical protein
MTDQEELEILRREVADLRARLARLEAQVMPVPTMVPTETRSFQPPWWPVEKTIASTN